jgi:hypothetical protein
MEGKLCNRLLLGDVCVRVYILSFQIFIHSLSSVSDFHDINLIALCIYTKDDEHPL